MGSGEDHVHHVETSECFLGGDLVGVNGGGRFADVHDFLDFPLVGEGDFDRGPGSDLQGGLVQRIKIFFFYVE
jgi:hypothetical protein